MKKHLTLLLVALSLATVGCSQMGKGKGSCCSSTKCECEAKPKGGCSECEGK